MLNKFINYTGLQTVIDWIKETFVQKGTGKGLSTEDYTTTDKQKVAAIPANPKYTDTIQDLTPYLEKTEARTTYATKQELEDVDVSEQLNSYQKTEAKGIAGGYAALGQDGKVPANQLPDDKDTITTINGKTGTISKADIVALGIPAQDTTYDEATTTTNGLMSSEDKTKLDGIETGAQKNTITSVQGKTGIVTISKSDVGLGNVNNVAVTQTDIDRLRGMSLDLFMTEEQYEALSTEEKNLPLTIYNLIEEA